MTSGLQLPSNRHPVNSFHLWWILSFSLFSLFLGVPLNSHAHDESRPLYDTGIELTLLAGTAGQGQTLAINSGDNVDYKYVINNTGTANLNINSIDDDVFGDILSSASLSSGDKNTDLILNPNEIWTYTFNASSVTTDVRNTVTVKANPVNQYGADLIGQANVSASASAQVKVYNAAISVIKTAGNVSNGNTLEIFQGDHVDYTYKVSNIGDTDLGSISLMDNPHGSIMVSGQLFKGVFESGDIDNDNVLDVNELWVFSLTVNSVRTNLTTIGIVNANPVFSDGTDIPGLGNPTDSDMAIVAVKQAGMVSGSVLEDTDGDEVGDIGVPDVNLTLSSGSEIQQTKTDVNGFYTFNRVLPGAFTITQEQPIGFTSVSDSQGRNDNFINGVMTSGGSSSGNNFIESKVPTETQTISGFVFADTTGDREGNVGIAQVLVTITDNDDVEYNVHTDRNGFYSFSIVPGKFTIIETDPVGYSSMADAQGKNNNKIKGKIESGETIEDLNFVDAENATLSGQVMQDIDKDNIADIPLAKTELIIIDHEGNRDDVESNTDGYFSSSIMPGPFTIIEKDPAGYRSIKDIDGVNDNIITGRAFPGQHIEGQDFLDALQVVGCALSSPVLSVVDNLCDPAQEGRIIALTDCAEAATAEYSIDGGLTWSRDLPSYDLNNRLSIMSRCIENEAQCSKEYFNFESFAGSDDPVADINKGTLSTHAVSLISLSVVYNGTAIQNDFEISDDHLAGSFGPKLGVDLADGIENSQEASYRFSSPISDFCFTINDIDQNDAAVINGSLRGAAVISLTEADFSFPFGAAACPIYKGNNTFESQCFGGVGNVKNSLQGAVQICFPTPIDQLDILFYDWNGTSGGSYTVSHFEVCTPQELCTSEVLEYVTSPQACCVQPAAPVLAVTDNECDPFTDGLFSVITDCPSGTTIEYSIDNGSSWSLTLPPYPSTGSAVIARCVNLDVNGCTSPPSTPVMSQALSCGSCLEFVMSSSIDVGPDGMATPGDLIRYSYDIKNCGNVQLSNINLEEKPHLFSGSGIVSLPNSLSSTILNPGENTHAIAHYEITQEDIDSGVVTKQAIATAQEPTGNQMSVASDSGNDVDDTGGQEDPTVTPLEHHPRLSMIKSSELNRGADGLATVGDVISYSYVVTNTGNVNLTNVSVREQQSLFTGSGSLPIPSGLNPSISLAPSESGTATATYELTQRDIDAGGITNQALASGRDPNGNELTVQSDSGHPADDTGGLHDPTQTHIGLQSCIELIVHSNLASGKDGAASVGDVISYTYELKNCGNVTLDSVSVTELRNKFTGGGILPMASAVEPPVLNPGDSGLAHANYTITQEDINNGRVINQARATGTDTTGNRVTDRSDSGNATDQDLTGMNDPTETPLSIDPCISINIASNLDLGADNLANPQDIIDYEYTITNCGNVTLDSVSMPESLAWMSGTGALPKPTALSRVRLDPSVSTKSFSSYAITQQDIDSGIVISQAMAVGIDPTGNEIVDKSDSDNSLDDTGASDDPTQTRIAVESCIELIKTSTLDLGSNNMANEGDIITYNFEFINCGNVTLDNITIEELDDLFTGSNVTPVPTNINPLILGPGLTGSGTASYSISQFDIDQGIVSNQATVTAQNPTGEEVTDVSDSGNAADDSGGSEDPTITSIPSQPCLQIIKSSSLILGSDGVANQGDQITYTYEVTNCGNVTLTDVSVQETLAKFTGTGQLPQPSILNPQRLAAGESGIATAIYTITEADVSAGVISNTASAIATDSGGNILTIDSDSGNIIDDTGADNDPTVTQIPQMPCLELIKSSVLDQGINSRSNPGDEIIYQYEVVNCGNVAITNVEITEVASQFTGSNALPVITNQPSLTLLPGELEVFNARYTINQVDIDAGAVSNQAIATGTTVSGTAVLDHSDSGNPLDETGGPEDPTVTPIPSDACVQLKKSSSFYLGEDNLSTPGDVITYTYVVRNCGQVSLTNLVIEESTTSFSGTGILPVPSVITPSSLAPGEEGIATALYAVTQADIEASMVSNQAVVSADPLVGDPIANNSDSGNPFDNLGTPFDPTTTPIGNCRGLACNSNVKISLNDCSLRLTADMILENPDLSNAYNIELYNNSGIYVRQDTLFASDVGETVNYKVNCGGNSCWGTIELESNVIPEIPAPCACDESGEIPASCQFWCGTGIPDAIVTTEEALRIYGDCGPKIIGDIGVTEIKTGDLCSEGGEVVELTYTIKVQRHDELESIELLCQRYSIEKLDIDLSESDFNSRFGFPRHVTLDCDYLSDLSTDDVLALGSPESIYAATGSGSLAYTFFVDQHQLVDLIRIDTLIEHVEVDTMHRKDFIQQDVDGDGIEEWILVTIIDKVYAERMVFDTVVIGQAHPEIPIVEQVCNLQTSYSDLEFNLCGGGLKIVRDWTVIDWCDSSIQRKGTQNIFIKDSHAPVVKNDEGMAITSLDDVVSLIDPWLCSSNVALPQLYVEDDCTTEIEVEWVTDDHIVKDGFILNVSPADSPLYIKGIVRDDCGNETNVSFTAIIKDDVAPVVVCEERAQVVLVNLPDSNEAVAKALASHFDAGSNDLSCGDISLTVVREEDWSEQILNCAGERVGYKPVSCGPQTTSLEFESKACGEEKINVTQPGEYVKFCCEDIGKELYVILIVTDDSGNRNTCRVPVQVLNKTAPIMVCEDQIVDCSDGDQLELPSMLSSDCQSDQYTIELLNETATTAVCSGGTIIREWYVDMDGNGDFNQGDSYCKQRLLVSGGTAFDPYSIKWPKSYDGAVQVGIKLHCEDGGIAEKRAPINMGEPLICNPENTQFMPSWCESACNLVGYSMNEENVNVDNACNKLVRTWAVIDWCTYDVNKEEDDIGDRIEAVDVNHGRDCVTCINEDRPYDDVYFRYKEVDLDGYYTYDQLIYIADDTAPTIDVLESLTVETISADAQKEDLQSCEAEINITANASDFCGGTMTSASQLKWTIRISVNGVQQSQLTAAGSTVDVDVKGLAGETRLVEWHVSDACGNVTTDTTQIIFIDNHAPTPVCLFGATTSYGVTDGMVEVWAKDLDFGSFDNCTALSDLRFSIVPDGQEPVRPGEDGFDGQGKIMFACDEFVSFAELNMWVWDADGNGSFCDASLVIGNNGNVCGDLDTILVDTMHVDTMHVDTMHVDTLVIDSIVMDSMIVDTSSTRIFTIAGDVYTSAGQPIDGVQVSINADLVEYPKSWTTFDEGHYAFSSNPEGFNYSIVADKDDSPTNGVSTLDLVLISRQIINMGIFMNPYQIIAADANGDGRLSAVDLVILKRIILGVTDEFSHSGPWTFIKADQEFIDEANPWPFTTGISMTELNQHYLAEDFIGIKMGDVNGSAQVNKLSSSEVRSKESLQLEVNNARLVEGELLQIDVRSKEFNDVFGMQFTLDHPGIELVDVIPGLLEVSVDDFGMLDEQSTFSWFTPQSIDSHEDEILFTLEIKATRELDLREALQLTSDLTTAEAYVSSNFDIHEVELDIVGEGSSFEVHQNYPNPFSEYTTIPFDMSQSGIVFVTIYTSEGKLLWSMEKDFTAGSHTIQLRSKDLDATGLLFYSISDGNRTVTKQMILINR